MATRIVAATTEKMESNIRCPNQRPAGFDRPLENCIAWTDDRRSCATYSVKKAGKTACPPTLISTRTPQAAAAVPQTRTIAAPKNAAHLSGAKLPALIVEKNP